MIIGIDEVGRGAWAGPLLVVAASCDGVLPAELKDSKVLSKTTREKLHGSIKLVCKLGEGWVSSTEIDDLGLSGAMRLGVERALIDIGANSTDEIILDGNINYCPAEFQNVKCEIKADGKYPIVSAASIYAKVQRDNLMSELEAQFPKYSFKKHVGYGTKLHLDEITNHGIINHHRKSFKPITQMQE